VFTANESGLNEEEIEGEGLVDPCEPGELKLGEFGIAEKSSDLLRLIAILVVMYMYKFIWRSN
jgi:hypothetical protein